MAKDVKVILGLGFVALALLLILMVNNREPASSPQDAGIALQTRQEIATGGPATAPSPTPVIRRSTGATAALRQRQTAPSSSEVVVAQADGSDAARALTPVPLRVDARVGRLPVARPSNALQRLSPRVSAGEGAVVRREGAPSQRTMSPYVLVAGGKKYIVQVGDTLAALANRFYDGQKSWQFLYEANKDRVDDPNMLRVGVEIVIPEVRASAPERSAGGTASSGSATRKGYYTVKPYDHLIKISRKVYGSARHWRDIWAANDDQIHNPDDLKVGMVLELPEVDE